MKLECPSCGKTCEFDYWERQVVDVTYPIDEEGHVFHGECKEFPDEVVKRFLECGYCGTRFYAKKERNDDEEADLKVSLGRLIQRGIRIEDDAEGKDDS